MAADDAVTRDRYGFVVSPAQVGQFREHAPLYLREEEERGPRWDAFLARAADALREQAAGTADAGAADAGAAESDIDVVVRALEDPAASLGGGCEGDAASPSARADLESELRVLVRGGIPMHLRGALWGAFTRARGRALLARGGRDNDEHSEGQAEGQAQRCAGGRDAQPQATPTRSVGAPAAGECAGANVAGTPATPTAQLTSVLGVSSPFASPATRAKRATAGQVEKDVRRSLPCHPVTEHEAGAEALRSVLLAYAEHNPSTGYCQGMNFVAALLLLFLDEADALDALVCLVDGVLEGYFTDDLEGMQCDAGVVRELLHSHYAAAAARLDALGVDVACVVPQWLMCAFVNSLPWETTLRLWDVLLYEQDRTVLFRASLALFEPHARALSRAQSSGDALTTLMGMAPAAFDASELVAHAMALRLDGAALVTLRAEAAERVAAQMAARHEMVRVDEQHIRIEASGDASERGCAGSDGAGESPGGSGEGAEARAEGSGRVRGGNAGGCADGGEQVPGGDVLALSSELRAATLQLGQLRGEMFDARVGSARAERRSRALRDELDARAASEAALRAELARKDEECAHAAEERAHLAALVALLSEECAALAARNGELCAAAGALGVDPALLGPCELPRSPAPAAARSHTLNARVRGLDSAPPSRGAERDGRGAGRGGGGGSSGVDAPPAESALEAVPQVRLSLSLTSHQDTGGASCEGAGAPAGASEDGRAKQPAHAAELHKRSYSEDPSSLRVARARDGGDGSGEGEGGGRISRALRNFWRR